MLVVEVGAEEQVSICSHSRLEEPGPTGGRGAAGRRQPDEFVGAEVHLIPESATDVVVIHGHYIDRTALVIVGASQNVPDRTMEPQPSGDALAQRRSPYSLGNASASPALERLLRRQLSQPPVTVDPMATVLGRADLAR